MLAPFTVLSPLSWIEVKEDRRILRLLPLCPKASALVFILKDAKVKVNGFLDENDWLIVHLICSSAKSHENVNKEIFFERHKAT